MTGMIQTRINRRIRDLMAEAKRYPNDADAYKYAASKLVLVKKDLVQGVKDAEAEFAAGENLVPVSWLIGGRRKKQ